MRPPGINIPEAQIGAEPTENFVRVRIEEPELCPRYTAHLVRGVKIGPSPDWMRSLLEKAGDLRSINNVVDLTNYVMLETGQPLHAFDFRLLAARAGELPSIVVKCAATGQEFVTLDGEGKHTLNEQTLLINDETKALALAGVMGGQNSEIGADTVDVLIESACFKPQNIRATSKKPLELRTDSSYRFERWGVDVGDLRQQAGLRAAQLILETAGGVLSDKAIDAYPLVAPFRRVSLRFAKCDRLLGVAIPAVQQAQFLERLGMKAVELEPDPRRFRDSPVFELDIKREVDFERGNCAALRSGQKFRRRRRAGAVGTNVILTRCMMRYAGAAAADGARTDRNSGADVDFRKFRPN